MGVNGSEWELYSKDRDLQILGISPLQNSYRYTPTLHLKIRALVWIFYYTVDTFCLHLSDSF